MFQRRPPLIRRTSSFAAGLAVLAGLTACVPIRTSPGEGNPGLVGIASWYGDEFHGRPTSNREIYDMYEMTAAHRTLPFHTRVRVHNLENGRSAVVRINDRGPFVKDRIIDLSYAAAQALDMVGPGTTRVRLEILGGPPPAAPRFSVQAGSFQSEANARRLAESLRPRYPDVFIAELETPEGIFYRIRIPASGREEGRRIASRLRQEGLRPLLLEDE